MFEVSYNLAATNLSSKKKSRGVETMPMLVASGANASLQSSKYVQKLDTHLKPTVCLKVFAMWLRRNRHDERSAKILIDEERSVETSSLVRRVSPRETPKLKARVLCWQCAHGGRWCTYGACQKDL